MQRKMLIIKAVIVIVAALGVIMLISGLVLHSLGTGQYTAADEVQMPEEYIEEFFSDENSEPQIEDYIEPEFIPSD